jgi:hypothetical protein
MSHTLFWDVKFHLLLESIDQELADQAQKAGCPECGHTLHQANYPRSPLGVPRQFRNHYEMRLSFCCEDCRKRMTPFSVRFLGRRWYPGFIFLLICAFMRGITEYLMDKMQRLFRVSTSESSWKRWRRWWKGTFVRTCFWKHAQGRVPHLRETQRFLPRALLGAFEGSFEEKMVSCLRFLLPLSHERGSGMIQEGEEAGP